MRIYVASSWRNAHQPALVERLRQEGHDVYDFRRPPGGTGFSWRQVQPGHVQGEPVDAVTWRSMVDHPVARRGYLSDLLALRSADAVVYVLPCGRSASWELGYAMALGKPAFLFWQGAHEPELMFREAQAFSDVNALADALAGLWSEGFERGVR